MGIGAGTAGLIAAGVTAAGAVGSAAISSSAAGKAGGQQASADTAASGQGFQALNNVTAALTPYTNLGTTSTGLLSNAITSGTDQTGTANLANANAELGYSEGYTQNAASIYGTLQNGINQQTLDNTPGYQFTLGQGLESTQNSAAARGLATSGAALKGASAYATGLANDTYQSQYQDLLNTAQGYSGLAQNETNVAGQSVNNQASLLDTNNQNYNQLLQGTQVGAQAANEYGEYAMQAAGAGSSYTAGAGQATASGTTGSASGINNGISSLGSGLTQSLLLNKLLGSSGTSGSTGITASGGNTGYVTLPS